MTDIHTQNKAILAPLRQAMVDFSEAGVREALGAVLAEDATLRMPYPLGESTGPDAHYSTSYAPLFDAMPDLERRDWIVMAGLTEHGGAWVGCGGHYFGTFVAPWLGIPPTGHLAHMRFHEFYRFEEGKVVEIQALWDIPCPWPPACAGVFFWRGRRCLVGWAPGPGYYAAAAASCDHVVDMLTHMKRHPSQGGADVMEMERFWHPRMNWYGPAGIGTGRGIAGFRNWHQIPFLNAMPDRGQALDEITYHFFGDGAYCGVTGWPNMIQTLTGDGWMGIAPAGKRFTMKSLDFWRMEDGLIRENWVMVDLLDAYDQLGVDVLGRMAEFNKTRVSGRLPFPVGVP